MRLVTFGDYWRTDNIVRVRSCFFFNKLYIYYILCAYIIIYICVCNCCLGCLRRKWVFGTHSARKMPPGG